MVNRQNRGFSLIELLIVVAIILVLAAIAIPNLLRSKINANEASAVASIRTINSAQVTYVSQYPTEGYADTLSKLGPGTPVGPIHADLLDSTLGCASQPCAKSGYKFEVVNASGTPVSNYGLTGLPLLVGSSGQRGFCSSQLIIVTQDPAGGTNCNGPVQ